MGNSGGILRKSGTQSSGGQMVVLQPEDGRQQLWVLPSLSMCRVLYISLWALHWVPCPSSTGMCVLLLHPPGSPTCRAGSPGQAPKPCGMVTPMGSFFLFSISFRQLLHVPVSNAVGQSWLYGLLHVHGRKTAVSFSFLFTLSFLAVAMLFETSEKAVVF